MLSPHVVLPSLCSTISKLSIGARFQLVVAILDTIFHQHCFVNITLAECRNMSSNDEVRNIVIRLISSLPEVVANKGHTGLRPHIFHHEKFFIFLGFEIVSALNQLANDVSMGKSVKTEFLSKCVGQFCRIGKAAQLFQVLIPSIVLKIESDFILQRILQQLFKGIPDVSLESVLTHLFQVWPIPHQLIHVLGD
uniref:Uncharacterized protein n=1 Tax=Ciona savignyi TaxID=51511 RepID=H2Z5M1_CIOSA